MRCSAADAFLRPAISRPNLTIATHAYASRLLFTGGTNVCGVEYIKDHQLCRAEAAVEVILSGGAFNSPQLLMLSGIGSAKALELLGIKVIHDLPGVGENLQDHFGVEIGCEINQPLSFSALASGVKATAMAEYNQTHTGPMAGNFLEAGAFAGSMQSEVSPKVQLIFVPVMPSPCPDSGSNAAHGMTFMGYITQPRSAGCVTLSSSDPLDRPVIDPNYLSDPEDMRVAKAAVRLNLEILRATAFDSVRTKATYPQVLPDDEDAMEAHIRRTGTTIWHVTGTCKMGHDSLAVVDEKLRLHGVDKLRVVDASVMPHIVSANTNAAVIMIAEKASDMIRGRASLKVAAHS
jgi:choline dehydrogenase